MGFDKKMRISQNHWLIAKTDYFLNYEMEWGLPHLKQAIATPNKDRKKKKYPSSRIKFYKCDFSASFCGFASTLDPPLNPHLS